MAKKKYKDPKWVFGDTIINKRTEMLYTITGFEKGSSGETYYQMKETRPANIYKVDTTLWILPVSMEKYYRKATEAEQLAKLKYKIELEPAKETIARHRKEQNEANHN